MVVTDHDIFAMLGETDGGIDGWERAQRSLDAAGGGGTYVLHAPSSWEGEQVKRMKDQGWHVHHVTNWEDIVAFARDFARARYGEWR
jgi:hypothetical protein